MVYKKENRISKALRAGGKFVALMAFWAFLLGIIIAAHAATVIHPNTKMMSTNDTLYQKSYTLNFHYPRQFLSRLPTQVPIVTMSPKKQNFYDPPKYSISFYNSKKIALTQAPLVWHVKCFYFV